MFGRVGVEWEVGDWSGGGGVVGGSEGELEFRFWLWVGDGERKRRRREDETDVFFFAGLVRAQVRLAFALVIFRPPPLL